MANGMDGAVIYNGEAQLAGWNESHTGGRKVVLWLPDDEALNAFKRLTLRKGGNAGQRLALAVVEVGDDEQPVVQPAPDAEPEPKPERWPGGPLSKLAGRWCHESAFMSFLLEEYPDYTKLVAARCALPGAAKMSAPEVAAEVLRNVLGIKSRVELDYDKDAAEAFHTLIRGPYCKRYLAQRG